MNIQLFSERCSGSNFLESVFNANLNGIHFTYEFGFKHWLEDAFVNTKTFPDNVPFIVLIRSPYNWIRSIYRTPWHAAHHLKDLPFSEFIRSEWYCVWDEQTGISKNSQLWMRPMDFETNRLKGNQRFKNVIEARRVKYEMWDSRLSSLPLYFKTSYEEFSHSPDDLLVRFTKAVDLPAPTEIKIPRGYKGNLSWKSRLLLILSGGRIGGFKQKPKEPISLEDIDYLHEQFDADQETFWGYDLNKLSAAERDYTLSSAKELSSTP